MWCFCDIPIEGRRGRLREGARTFICRLYWLFLGKLEIGTLGISFGSFSIHGYLFRGYIVFRLIRLFSVHCGLIQYTRFTIITVHCLSVHIIIITYGTEYCSTCDFRLLETGLTAGKLRYGTVGIVSLTTCSSYDLATESYIINDIFGYYRVNTCQSGSDAILLTVRLLYMPRGVGFAFTRKMGHFKSLVV